MYELKIKGKLCPIWLLFQSFCNLKHNLQSFDNFSETKKCWTHGDCPRHLRCTNGFCGDRNYYEALKNRKCEDDSICEVRKDF